MRLWIRRNQKRLCLCQVVLLASGTVMGCCVIVGVYWSCSCRVLVSLGGVGCAYETCQYGNKGCEDVS